MGLYLLLSHQISIHGHLKKELLSGKPTNEDVSHEVWITYLKSSAHSRITKLVECDLKHLETYFSEVKSRVSVSLKDKKNIDNKSALLGSFVKYYNAKDGHDDECYQQCILELVKILKEKSVKDKLFLLKMTISTNPFKYLPKNLDFGLFYEAEEEEL